MMARVFVSRVVAGARPRVGDAHNFRPSTTPVHHLLILRSLSSTSRKIVCASCPHNDSADCQNDCADWLKWDRDYVLHPYSSMTEPLPVYPVQSARGVHLQLQDGRQLIDGMSSWWAAVHGYRHPFMDEAIRHQVESSMSHVMFGGLTHQPAATLGKRLVDWTNLDKIFFSDSGSVAVEVAMKMAIQYWDNTDTNNNSKTRFVSLTRGYHGDTFGAMSVCDPVNGMHSLFRGTFRDQIFVESPAGPLEKEAEKCATDAELVLQQSSDEIAAVILEPIVQGAGGMRFYHPSLLQKLRQLCDEHNVLLIFDEIATGFGRTGTIFACQQKRDTFQPWYSSQEESHSSAEEKKTRIKTTSYAVLPDIMCLGKALTGGYMTLGATLTSNKVAEGISSGGGVFMHGPTFMANPLACTAGLASLELLSTSPWQQNIEKVQQALITSMAPAAQLESVAEVRVLGGIGVCELHEPIKDMAKVQQALVERGVWLRPFGKLLYTMPPFNCPDMSTEHVTKIGQTICEVAAEC